MVRVRYGTAARTRQLSRHLSPSLAPTGGPSMGTSNAWRGAVASCRAGPPHTAARTAESRYLANGGDRLQAHQERPVHSAATSQFMPLPTPAGDAVSWVFPPSFSCPNPQQGAASLFSLSCLSSVGVPSRPSRVCLPDPEPLHIYLLSCPPSAPRGHPKSTDSRYRYAPSTTAHSHLSTLPLRGMRLLPAP